MQITVTLSTHCCLLLSWLLCLSVLVCFFSPLTVAQLKTELLGSKFNSILEETTVRFPDKYLLRKKHKIKSPE